MSTIKHYKKKMVNPLGLPSGAIHNKTFTDEKLTGDDKVKLALAIKAKMVVEYTPGDVEATDDESGVTVEDVQADSALKDDVIIQLKDNNTILTNEKKELTDKVELLENMLFDGFDKLDAKQLADGFTIPELKYIADNLCKQKVEYKADVKEAVLTAAIVKVGA